MKILSIDFDYYNDASDVALYYYPDSGREYRDKLMDIIWLNLLYGNKHSKEALHNEVKILESDYTDLCNYISSHKFKKTFASDSHTYAYQFITDLIKKNKKEDIEIVNIDFHHDTYSHTGKLDCGSWLEYIIRENPNAKVSWVNKGNSSTDNLDKKVNIITHEEALSKDYDYVYICRSGAWSCPLLDKYFVRLTKRISESTIGLFGITTPSIAHKEEDDFTVSRMIRYKLEYERNKDYYDMLSSGNLTQNLSEMNKTLNQKENGDV